MRVVVLGGAGDMGSRVVEDLLTNEDVERVTIADRDALAANKVAAKYFAKGFKVDVEQIDANNHDQLVRVMRGHEVAASTIGPFHAFESKLVRAAIDAEIDYASICDEWEAAEAVMDEFGEEAKEKGRTIITGLGTSPGFSNIGIRYMADQFDKLRKAEISVYQPIAGGGGEAVVRHMFHIMSGDIAVWRGGKRVLLKALSEERMVEFPKFGKIKTWNMGHSEPATVPKYFPDLEECNFYMGLGRGASLFIQPAKRGWFQKQSTIERLVGVVGFIERLAGSADPEWGAVRLDAWGEIDGKEEHKLVCGIGEMREATGLSLSIGALMLARKQLIVEEPGIYAPEGCFNPKTFIEIMAEKGIVAYEDLEMTKRVK